MSDDKEVSISNLAGKQDACVDAPHTVGIIQGRSDCHVHVNYLSGKLVKYLLILHRNPLHAAPPAAAYRAITCHKDNFNYVRLNNVIAMYIAMLFLPHRGARKLEPMHSYLRRRDLILVVKLS